MPSSSRRVHIALAILVATLVASAVPGCGDRASLRRGTAVEAVSNNDGHVLIGGTSAAGDVVLEGTGSAIIFQNDSDADVTIVIRNAPLATGDPANIHVAQFGPDIATDRPLPPGGIACVRFASPGSYPYEVRGAPAALSGSIQVR